MAGVKSYGKRIDTLCGLLVKTEIFADIGCDHGYCTEYALENGICDFAVFSDISKGSLAKAEKLLRRFVEQGRAKGVLGDGFRGVAKDTGEVLIAGMGGSEIVHIFSHPEYGFLPKRFVLQPMHDSEKLRRYLIAQGAYIERDFTFRDGKFYDVIVGGFDGRAMQAYNAWEYEFGRENLEKRNADFLAQTEKRLKNVEEYLLREGLGEESIAELQARKERLQGVLSGEIK